MKQRSKKLQSVLLMLVMTVGMFLIVSIRPAHAETFSYKDADGTTQQAEAVILSTAVNEQGPVLGGGWYVVNSNMEFDQNLGFSGDVTLILCDEASLTLPYYMTRYAPTVSLTIYGQSGGTGALIVANECDFSTINLYGGSLTSGEGVLADTITVKGGTMDVTGRINNEHESGCTIDYYDGTIDAKGGSESKVTVNVKTACSIAYTDDPATDYTVDPFDADTVWDDQHPYFRISRETTSIQSAIFDLNYAGGSKTPQPLETGVTIVKPADPQREFYTFTGWYADAECTTPFTSWIMPEGSVTIYAGWKEDPKTKYLGADGNLAEQHTYVLNTNPAYSDFDNANNTYYCWWDREWYYADTTVTIPHRIKLKGDADVNLILGDGVTLKAEKGIEIPDGITLKIYSQSEATGELIASGSNDQAVIAGDVIIYNGNMTVSGGSNQAGIVGDVTVNDGRVDVMGGSDQAGIVGNVIVNDGRVNVTGGSNQAGIVGNVTVNDGSVNATGGDSANAIEGELVVSNTELMVLSGNNPSPSTPQTDLTARYRYMNIGKPLYTIFLENKDGWMTPYCYVTDGGEKNNGTGGQAMVKDGSYWRISVNFVPTQVTFYDGTTQKISANITSFQTIGGENFQFTSLGGGCTGRFFVTAGGGIIVTLLYNGSKYYPNFVTYRVESGRNLMDYASIYDQYPTKECSDGSYVTTNHWERIDQYGVAFDWYSEITESIVISVVYNPPEYVTVTLYKLTDNGYSYDTVEVAMGAPLPENLRVPTNNSSNQHLKFQYWTIKDTSPTYHLRAGQKFDISQSILTEVALVPVYTCPHHYSTYEDGKSFYSKRENSAEPHPSSMDECYNLCVTKCDWCGQIKHCEHDCQLVIYRGKAYKNGYCINEGCTYTDPNLNRTNYVKIERAVEGDSNGFIYGGNFTLFEGNVKSYATFTYNAPEYMGLVFDYYTIIAQGSGKTVTQYDPKFSVSLKSNYAITAWYKHGNFFDTRAIKTLFAALYSRKSSVTLSAYKYDTQYDNEDEKAENEAYFANHVNLDIDWKVPDGAEISAAGILTTTNKEMQKYNFGLNDEGQFEASFDDSCLIKDNDTDAEFSANKQEELKKRMIAGDGYCSYQGKTTIHEFNAELLHDQGFFRVAHELPTTAEEKAYFGPWIYAMGYVTYTLNGEEVTEYTDPIAVRLEDLSKDGYLDKDVAVPIMVENVADLIVYVDGELDPSLSRANMIAGDVVTLTAPAVEGKTFSHWAVGSADGPVASRQQTYMLGVKADTVLYAVYATTAPADTGAAVAFVSMTKESYMGDSAMKLNSIFSLPESQSASSTGIIFTYNKLLGVADKEKDLLVDKIDAIDVEALLKSGEDDARLRVSSGERTGAVGGWSATLGLPGMNDHVYAVAYVEIDGNRVYSDVLDVTWEDFSATRSVSSKPEDFDLEVPEQSGN